MDNFHLMIITFQNDFILLTQIHDADSILGQINEALWFIYEETKAFRLPQLKALMSKDGILVMWTWIRDIHDCQIISICVDCFVRHNKFFYVFFLIL